MFIIYPTLYDIFAQFIALTAQELQENIQIRKNDLYLKCIMICNDKSPSSTHSKLISLFFVCILFQYNCH